MLGLQPSWTIIRRARVALLPVGVGISLVGLAPQSLARPDQAPAAGQDNSAHTIFAFEHAAVGDMLSSPKDAALVAAISMLPARIDEILHAEGFVPNSEHIPGWLVPTIHDLITGPGRIAVTRAGMDENTHMPKLGLVASHLCHDAASAAEMGEHFDQLRQMTPLNIQPTPSTHFKGMQEMAVPGGILSYGVRSAKDGQRFEIIFGNIDDPDAPFAALPTSSEVRKPTARALLDFAALSPIAEMFGGMASMWAPNSGELMQSIRSMGLVGADALSVEMVSGFDDQGMASTLTVRRAGKHADAWGLSKTTLSDADYAVLPVDTIACSIKKQDLLANWQKMKTGIAKYPQAGHILDQINEKLGIDIENDLIATLGTTSAAAIAESTGGNSLFGGVLFMEVKDHAKLAATLDKLASKANECIDTHLKEAGEEQGKTIPFSIRVVSTGADSPSLKGIDVHGARLTQIKFMGLPVPIEPTLALTDHWLVVGATPQAVVGALAGAGKGGIRSSALLSKYASQMHDAISFSVLDSGVTIRDGYSLTLMGGEALGNFVHSYLPGVNRDAGMVVPPLSVLRDNLRPMVQWSHWSGDDLVVSGRADGSMLANVASILGTGDIGPIVTSVMVGAGMGAGMAQQNHGMHPPMRAREPHARGHHGEDADGHKDGMDKDDDGDDEPDDADAPPPPHPPEPPANPDAPDHAPPHRKMPS